ncbi:hypothetical protein HLB42_21795 (plasmid) [Deinococcus sp. D7000]|nr:hypothetical protein HLB42_21795 [Deinococcus sp. D7000]
MGDAKRRRELGHLRRQNTYRFVVSEGPVIEYLGREPVDEDDAGGVSDMVNMVFDHEWMSWAEQMDELLVDHGVERAPGLPTHVRCEMTVIRTRNGSWLYFDSPNLQEQAYSVDGGKTWYELAELQTEPSA